MQKAPVTIRKKTFTQGQKMKAVVVYYPQMNRKLAALLDEDNKLVSFNQHGLYHPSGGMASCKDLAESGNAFVNGSNYWAYDCRNVHGNVYMLGNKH